MLAHLTGCLCVQFARGLGRYIDHVRATEAQWHRPRRDFRESACLPQRDPLSARRIAEIEARRLQFPVEQLPGRFPRLQGDEVPPSEKWPWKVRLLFAGSAFLRTIVWRLHRDRRTTTPETVAQIVTGLGRKPASIGVEDDESFARQRVAGINPLQIRRCTPAELPEPLRARTRKRHEARLFAVTYEDMEGLKTTHREVYHATPKAFFVEGSRGLTPLGIELAGIVYTPDDPPHVWLAAKLWVQYVDSRVAALVHHVTLYHFMQGIFPLATARCLSQRHPLHRLLFPFCEYNLQINKVGLETLFTDEQAVTDRLSSLGTEAQKQIEQRIYESFDWSKHRLDHSLTSRRVTQGELTYYPFREDALASRRAMRDLVSGYLGLYYTSPADLSEDSELAAWNREVRDMLPSFPQLDSFDALVENVTDILYHATVGHQTVHYPQFDYHGSVYNSPFAMYLKPPRSKDEIDPSYIERLLPRRDYALFQASFAFIVSRAYTTIGTVLGATLNEPRHAPIVQKFLDQLAQIDARIADRPDRPPYAYLSYKQLSSSLNY